MENELYRTLYDAYIYAMPLVLFDLTEHFFTNTVQPASDKAPLNQLHHAQRLATPETKDLLFPNADTVYSQAYYDLRSGPYLFEKPATDRYCSIQLIDGYTDTVEILGTGGLGEGAQGLYAFVPAGFRGELPEGAVAIEVPTAKLWILIRTLIYGPEDVGEVKKIQEQMKTYPLAAYGKPYDPPAGTYSPAFDYVPIEALRSMDLEAFFNRFNELSLSNPGRPADKDALARFARVGIGPGLTFHMPESSGKFYGRIERIPQDAEHDVLEQNKMYELVHKWIYMNPNISRSGTDYVLRAAVAYGGTANPVSMAAYVTTLSDRDNEPLNGKNEYVIHFATGKFPPSGENAFWSITAYSNGYLIANPLKRYAVGSRSQFVCNPDGSLDLYLAQTLPHGVPRANYLPVNDQDFMLTMRIYRPRPELFDKTWKPPYVEKYVPQA